MKLEAVEQQVNVTLNLLQLSTEKENELDKMDAFSWEYLLTELGDSKDVIHSAYRLWP